MESTVAKALFQVINTRKCLHTGNNSNSQCGKGKKINKAFYKQWELLWMSLKTAF